MSELNTGVIDCGQTQAEPYAPETVAILSALGETGVESVQAALSSVDQGTPPIPEIIDVSVRKHRQHENLRHRRELLRGLGYRTLSDACPDIASTYAGLGSASTRLKRKVAAGEVGLIGLLAGSQQRTALKV